MGKVKGSPGPSARRPDNSAFKQQRLPAWSPMLTANTVLPFFYFMALICMLLGVWLLITVQRTQELKVSVCVFLEIVCLFGHFFVLFLICGNIVVKCPNSICVKEREREKETECPCVQ